MGTKKRKTKRKPDIMRRLDPSDPRSLDHPCHKEQWLELARSIGRSMANADWEKAEAKRKR